MDFLSAQDLQEIRQILELPKIEVILKKRWGSENPSHREEIHGEVKKRMGQLGPFFDASIAHTQSLGGFSFIQYPQESVIQIGMDLEVIARTQEATVQRVSSDNEYAAAPSPAALWVAKEASFKSLKGPQQPKTIGQLVIGDWKKHSSHIETYSLLNIKDFKFASNQGLVLSKENHAFSLFVARA